MAKKDVLIDILPPFDEIFFQVDVVEIYAFNGSTNKSHIFSFFLRLICWNMPLKYI